MSTRPGTGLPVEDQCAMDDCENPAGLFPNGVCSDCQERLDACLEASWLADQTDGAGVPLPTPLTGLDLVLIDVRLERRSQDTKWGVQDHPSVPPPGPLYLHGFLGIVAEEVAKRSCDDAFAAGSGTWAHIAVEELAEAVEAKDEVDRREELVQLAAVIIAWIECIDRIDRWMKP